jgi:hypothetical protein
VQETSCPSIELPNEVGHSSPLKTTTVVTRVRFPSPAPDLKSPMVSSRWRFFAFSKSQSENESENIDIPIRAFTHQQCLLLMGIALLKNGLVRITVRPDSNSRATSKKIQ